MTIIPIIVHNGNSIEVFQTAIEAKGFSGTNYQPKS